MSDEYSYSKNGSPDINTFQNFEEVAEETLKFLHKKYGFGLWMVTRTIENDWIVLKVQDEKYGVKDHEIFKWSDSFCYHMVQQKGPNIAPFSEEIEPYANAPIGKVIPIKSYIGYPLRNNKGELFGTLCAIDPNPQPRDLVVDNELLALISKYLSFIISNEKSSLELRNQIGKLVDEVYHDQMTGLLSRAAWDKLVGAQEQKSRLFEEPALIIIMDLDGLKQINDTKGHEAGDEYIKLAAKVLHSISRKGDAVARLGGDEFAMLIESTKALDPQPFVERIKDRFLEAGVKASIGYAVRSYGQTIYDCIKQADEKMYVEKRAHYGAMKQIK